MPRRRRPPQDTTETAAERRSGLDQALASTRLSGHVPRPEFLADCEDYIAGRITHEEILAREVKRVLGTKSAVDAT
ncbi:MAG: antitoxin VbhA family protein [Reyranella sp.]